MENNLGKDISELTKEDIKAIKMLSFDGDGVVKKIGTEFVEVEGGEELRSYRPSTEMMNILERLSEHFFININSGRSVEYLAEMFGNRHKFVYLGEIGMYSFVEGKKVANFELSDYEKVKIEQIRQELAGLKDKKIKGLEPKSYLVTLHCDEAIKAVEDLVAKIDTQGEIYCWWTGEAYDIGSKRITKKTGLEKLCQKLAIGMENVMTIGHGVNDADMLNRIVGIDISTDADNLKADFVTRGEEVGGLVVVKKILDLVKL